MLKPGRTCYTVFFPLAPVQQWEILVSCCFIPCRQQRLLCRCVQIVLVYTEGILIAQYVYQIPTRLHCPFVSASFQQRMEILGLHGSGFRGIPIFLVYLATLMHTYRLSRQQVRAVRATSGDTCPGPLERLECVGGACVHVSR